MPMTVSEATGDVHVTRCEQESNASIVFYRTPSRVAKRSFAPTAPPTARVTGATTACIASSS